MYEITYKFSLDITDKSLKETCEKIGCPYPVIPKGIEQTLRISNLQNIPTKEQTNSVIQKYRKAVKGKTIGQFLILDAHFEHIVDVFSCDDTKTNDQKSISKKG